MGMLIGWLSRAFMWMFFSQFIVKWVKALAILAAKIALFWLCWQLVSKQVYWLIDWVFSYVWQYFPAAEGWVLTLISAARVTAAWFPWEFLGLCLAAIITFKLWLLGIKVTLAIWRAVHAAIEFMLPAGST